MTIVNLNRTEGTDLAFEVVGPGTAGGYHWKFVALYDGPNIHPVNFDELWEAFHPEDTDRVGHLGNFTAIKLTRTIATKITWTFQSGQLDEGLWMEAYSPSNPNPGSVGSQLYAIDIEDTPGDQWEFMAATMNDPPVAAAEPWQYETVYEGGILSLADDPELWGDAVDIPMNVKNLSRHDPDMDLVFNAVGVGHAGGFYWRFEVTYDGPEDDTDFANKWEEYHPGDAGRVGHLGFLDTITLTRMQEFEDIPPNYWAEEFIYKIFNAGITSGCSADPFMYCPTNPVTRAQMAVFLERGIRGSDFDPPAASGIFDDVPVDYWAAAWIEQLYNDGITKGCFPGLYCPNDNVTRAQMAVFLLRAKHGDSYMPPAATGIFSDVNLDYWAADWIEQLYNEGITGGCGTNPLRYCPNNSVTRAQMAVFLVRAFEL
jgi:hypothetical protein